MQFIINASVRPTHVAFASVAMQNLPLPKLRLENEILYYTYKQKNIKMQPYNNALPPSQPKSHRDQL